MSLISSLLLFLLFMSSLLTKHFASLILSWFYFKPKSLICKFSFQIATKRTEATWTPVAISKNPPSTKIAFVRQHRQHHNPQINPTTPTTQNLLHFIRDAEIAAQDIQHWQHNLQRVRQMPSQSVVRPIRRPMLPCAHAPQIGDPSRPRHSLLASKECWMCVPVGVACSALCNMSLPTTTVFLLLSRGAIYLL